MIPISTDWIIIEAGKLEERPRGKGLGGSWLLSAWTRPDLHRARGASNLKARRGKGGRQAGRQGGGKALVISGKQLILTRSPKSHPVQWSTVARALKVVPPSVLDAQKEEDNGKETKGKERQEVASQGPTDTLIRTDNTLPPEGSKEGRKDGRSQHSDSAQPSPILSLTHTNTLILISTSTSPVALGSSLLDSSPFHSIPV